MLNFFVQSLAVFCVSDSCKPHLHSKRKSREIDPPWPEYAPIENGTIVGESYFSYASTHRKKVCSTCRIDLTSTRSEIPVVCWCCRLLQSPKDEIQKIEKTLKNAQTTIQRRTNNSLRNTKKTICPTTVALCLWNIPWKKSILAFYFLFLKTLIFSSTSFKSTI